MDFPVPGVDDFPEVVFPVVETLPDTLLFVGLLETLVVLFASVMVFPPVPLATTAVFPAGHAPLIKLIVSTSDRIMFEKFPALNSVWLTSPA